MGSRTTLNPTSVNSVETNAPAPSAAPVSAQPPRIALGIRRTGVVVAILGAAVMLYLSFQHYVDALSTLCDFGEGVSCSVVNQSIYSELLGIPLAPLGVAYFLTMAWLLIGRRAGAFRWVLLASIVSLVFGAYLTVVEVYVLYSVCVFCETSKVAMIALIALALAGARAEGTMVPPREIFAAILAGAVFSAGAWLLQKEPSYDAVDYAPIAQCLTDNGVVMYGTYWCPKCAKQRRMFGPAMELIDEIECDARGENAQPERCVERGIRGTPTWMREADGRERQRHEGVATPERLAEIFGCPALP